MPIEAMKVQSPRGLQMHPLFLVAMPGATTFLLLVVRPGALLVASLLCQKFDRENSHLAA